jgi:hypothetical protein
VTSAAAAAAPDPRPVWRRPIALPRLPPAGDRWALAGLAAIVAALCWPVIARGRVYWERDVHLYLYPHAEAFVRVLAQGSLPLWNPYVAFGEPLLANPQMQVFYPPTWLNLVMKPWTWYAGFVVAHLLFTAAGAYWLARRLGTSRLGASVAGAAWVASGPLVSLVNNCHHLAGAAWMPWVLAFSDAAFATRRIRDLIASSLAMGLQILAGSADMSALTALLVASNALRHVDWRASRRAKALGLVRTAVTMVVIGLGLTAAQWMPTLDVARRSSRFDQPERIRTYWSMHPVGVLQMLAPAPLHDLPLSPEVRAALSEGREPFLTSLYLGLPAAGLVLFALTGTARARGMAVLLALAIVMALGRHTPVFAVVTTLVPPLGILRYPVKATVPAALLWATLVGLGVDAAARVLDRRRWRALAFSAAVIVGVAAVALSLEAQSDTWGGVFLGRAPGDPPFAAALAPLAHRIRTAAILAALVWLGAACARSPRTRVLAAGAAGAATVLDLLIAHHGLNRTCPPQLMALRPPAADAARAANHLRTYAYDYYVRTRGSQSLGHPPYALANVPPDPVMGAVALRTALYPSVLGQWGIESSYDLDQQGLFPAELANLSRFLRIVEGTPTHLRLLRMGAVGRVTALHTAGLEDLTLMDTLPSLFQEPLRIYGVPEPMSRVSMASASRIADGEAAWAALQDPGFDPRREVLLPAGVPLPPAPALQARTRVTQWRPDRVTVEVEADRRCYLVLADAFDPGWRTRVDGQDVPLLRANIAFRAVAVPAGRHVVDSIYRPRAIAIGLAVSLATAGVTLAVCSRRGR